MALDTRELVSYQVISELTPHPNADRLEIATVKGWKVIVGKDYFTINEKVVFFEVDSLIPKDPSNPALRWIDETLRKKFAQSPCIGEWYLLRTLKLRDVLSQGLVMKICDFPFVLPEQSEDLTKFLEVVRHKTTIDDAIDGTEGIIPFPSHILPKSHEARVQSYPNKLKALIGNPYWITLKIDGTSGSYFYDSVRDCVVVCSRNQSKGFIKRPVDGEYISLPNGCYYTQMVYKYKLHDILCQYPDIAIQGEVYGKGINLNPLGKKDVHLAIFHIHNKGDYKAWSYPDMGKWCKDNKLEVVPLLESGDCLRDVSKDEIITLAEGKYPNTSKNREGIVIRNIDNTLSFKVLNNQALLKRK